MIIATFESDKAHFVIEEDKHDKQAHRFHVGFKAPEVETFSFPVINATHKQALMWFRRMIKTSKHKKVTFAPADKKIVIKDWGRFDTYKTVKN